jgi:hypothetical protein
MELFRVARASRSTDIDLFVRASQLLVDINNFVVTLPKFGLQFGDMPMTLIDGEFVLFHELIDAMFAYP